MHILSSKKTDLQKIGMRLANDFYGKIVMNNRYFKWILSRKDKRTLEPLFKVIFMQNLSKIILRFNSTELLTLLLLSAHHEAFWEEICRN